MNYLVRLAILVAVFWLLRRAWIWFWASGWKRLLQYFLGPIQVSSSGGSPAERRGKLVRDPVCGTHVDVSLAVQATADGEVQYFCSERCRDSFRENPPPAE
jgi:YHS domain-containing protein